MKVILPQVRITVLIFFLLPGIRIYSQNRMDNLRLTPEYLPVSELISKFRKLHHLRIYYQPEWFEGKKLAASNLNQPVEEFINLLSRTARCSIVRMDSLSFVLVAPDDVSDDFSSAATGSTWVIGNPEEYGKYRKAMMSGKVVDGKTGETLPGVSVFVNKLKLGSTTDPSGHFQLELPVGEYDVTVSFIGYEPSVRHIRLVSNGSTTFELFDKSHHIEEVIVTLDRPDFNVTRTQMSLIKLDNKSIKELPVSLGELDIIKSVSLLPGIQSSGEFGTGLFVRGGSSDQNLILVEEVPVFNASHLFGLTSIINPDNIAAVTLLKAGVPARYGERSSAVMDIRLGAPGLDKTRVRGGIGLLNSRISLNLPAGKKISLLLGGRTSYSNWLLHKMPDVDLMNSSAGFYDVNGLITVNFNPENRINLFGYVSRDKFGLGKTIDYSYGNRLGSLRWNHIFGKTLTSVLVMGVSQYYFNTSEQDTLHLASGYRINSSLLYKNLKYNVTWIPVRNRSIDLGFTGINYSIQPGSLRPYDHQSLVVPVNLQKEQALEYAFYLSSNMTFSPRFSSEAGLRYSGYVQRGPGTLFQFASEFPRSEESVTDTLLYKKNEAMKKYSGFEPRISIRYTFNENTSLKFSLTRMRQYINLVSNTTVMNPADIWKLSNSCVKPLTCDQAAIGYFRNFRENSYETSVELYYKRLNHIIEYKNGARLMLNPAIEADLLDASGYNWGLEFFSRKNTGRLTGWLSYAYSASKRRTSGKFREEQVNGNRWFSSSYEQPHSINMVGNYQLSRKWKFSWTFTYSTGRPVTLPELTYTIGNDPLIWYSDRNKYRLPDYHRMDIAISRDESLKIKKFWKGSWTFSIINLYGRKNKYSVFYHKEPPVITNTVRFNSLYALYIIGRPLPTLTYNFTF